MSNIINCEEIDEKCLEIKWSSFSSNTCLLLLHRVIHYVWPFTGGSHKCRNTIICRSPRLLHVDQTLRLSLSTNVYHCLSAYHNQNRLAQDRPCQLFMYCALSQRYLNNSSIYSLISIWYRWTYPKYPFHSSRENFYVYQIQEFYVYGHMNIVINSITRRLKIWHTVIDHHI